MVWEDSYIVILPRVRLVNGRGHTAASPTVQQPLSTNRTAHRTDAALQQHDSSYMTRYKPHSPLYMHGSLRHLTALEPLEWSTTHTVVAVASVSFVVTRRLQIASSSLLRCQPLITRYRLTDMQVAGGGRKRVRATRSASTTSDGSETAAAGTDAAAEAIVDAAADTATSPPTGDAAAVHSTSSYETAHIAAAHSAAPVAAAAAAVGAVDDGNGRGKRSKTRRGGATADTVKPEDSTATNGHSAPTTQTTDDDRHNATAGTVHAVSTVQPPVSTADGRDTAAIVRPATRSPSTTQSNPTTPLATQGHTHQVIHSDPPDPHSVPPAHPLNVGAVIPPLPTFPTSSRGYVAYFYWYLQPQ